MRRSGVIPSLVTTLVVVLAACSGGTPGVESPIDIGGVDVQVESTRIQDSYSTGQSEYSAKSRSDTLLVVRAEVSASTDDFDPDGWNVRVQDQIGRMSEPDLRIATTGVVGGVEQHSLTWLFAVNRNSDHFTLLLLDRQVDLAPLLDEDPATD